MSPAAHVDGARRRARARARRAGFTMVELTVALLAGLLVAMGIVALSREATNTFHDEARASVAEASLRAAMDRLRSDLQRAGYMSTANFLADPAVATSPGVSPAVGMGNYAGISGLQSIHLMAPAAPLALSGINGLAPDVLEISGNMTTADEFDVAYIAPLSGTCQKIYLSPTSPAMYRLIGDGGAGAANLGAAFQPYAGSQFIVRLVDDAGRAQFLVTCGSGAAAGIDTGVNLPYVAVDTSPSGTPLKTAQNTGTMAALTGPAAGRAWVNPVAIVHWEIVAASTETAQYTNGLQTQTGATGVADPTKYDLVRTLVDAHDNAVVNTSEVIAEYAADLKFAFSVAGTAAAAADPQSISPTVTTYDFSSTNNATVGGAIRSGGGGGTPQRIRSVRMRLTTRASQADRTATIPVLPAYSDTYLYRYCILPGGCTSNGTTLQYARARTLTTEVTVPNQAKAFY